jgi:hypothetical protein
VAKAGLTNPAPGAPTQDSKNDQPVTPQPAPKKKDSVEWNPICKDLKSLAGTLTSQDLNLVTTLTGTLTEAKPKKDAKASPSELRYTSKEKLTDSSGATVKEYDAEFVYNPMTCTFRMIPSRDQGYTGESNRKILLVKKIDNDEVEIKTQVCKNSVCTDLKDEIKIYHLCLANAAPASADATLPESSEMSADGYQDTSENATDARPADLNP